MLDTYHATFCEHCQQLATLSETGKCPNCGEICEVLPEQVRVESLLNAELIRINRLFFVNTRLRTRGSLEQGTSDHWVIRGVVEKARAIPPRKQRDITDVVLINELPKLDIVVMELRHRHSPEEVAIHHAHYSDRYYARGQLTSVSEPAACEDRLLDEVFAAELLPEHAPGFAENAPGPLRFCHLRQALALLQAHNSLWYAALASGFYTMIGYLEPDAPPHD